jgi:hypothetical protein
MTRKIILLSLLMACASPNSAVHRAQNAVERLSAVVGPAYELALRVCLSRPEKEKADCAYHVEVVHGNVKALLEQARAYLESENPKDAEKALWEVNQELNVLGSIEE